MCEDEKGYKYGEHHHEKHHQMHHGIHHRMHHGHCKYSTLGKKSGDSVKIPEILFEVANIQEGDYFKVSIRKIHKNKE